MYLGREALGANKIPVYTMPRMKKFLESNGPWSQLVSINNVSLKEIENNQKIQLSENLKVIPFYVPHRDEFSETVGYKIIGKNKSALFIPDIDKWELWERSIIDEVKSVDYAFLDATFFSGDEINRSMKEIPHSFVLETIDIFMDEDLGTKNKIHFIHFNHTNPLLNQKINLRDSILKLGFNFAKFGNKYDL
jgi:pyrroloquinoline quinone biosynthesis protein B